MKKIEYRHGTIIWDTLKHRYDLYFGGEEYYGGLLCGEPFEVEINNRWVRTRLELGKEGWYLVGIGTDFLALYARVKINTIQY